MRPVNGLVCDIVGTKEFYKLIFRFHEFLG